MSDIWISDGRWEGSLLKQLLHMYDANLQQQDNGDDGIVLLLVSTYCGQHMRRYWMM